MRIRRALILLVLPIWLLSCMCPLANFASQIKGNQSSGEPVDRAAQVISETPLSLPTSTNKAELSPTNTSEPTLTDTEVPSTLSETFLNYQDTSMYRVDLNRSGVYSCPGPKTLPNLLWEFEAEDSIYSTPAISEGLIYFGSHDGSLYALNVESGELIWEFETGDMVLTPPTISNGTIYFGSDDGFLYALDTNRGEMLWKFQTGDWVSSSPAIYNDMLYFGSYDGNMYALNAQSGEEIWKFEVAGINDPVQGLQKGVGASPAVANGLVLFGSEQYGGASHELFFYGLDWKTGEKVWDFAAWNVVTSPVVWEGKVYFGGFGSLFGLDVQTGSLVFDYGNEIVSTAPAIHNGVAYYGSEEGFLIAVDLEGSEKKWTFSTGCYIINPPSISDNVVYFGSSDGLIRALDAGSGKTLWEFDAGEGISTSPVIFDGVIYIGTDEGHLFAIGSD